MSNFKQKEANAYGEFSEDDDIYDEEYVAPKVIAPRNHMSK